MEQLRLAYIIAMLLVVSGSTAATGVAYYVTRSRLAGASLGFVAYHMALILVHLAHKSQFLVYGYYSATVTAFFIVFLFAAIFVYPYYYGAISGRQTVLTTSMLVGAAVVATVTKLVFDSLIPNVVLVMALLASAVVGFTAPGGEGREREQRHVRALSIALAVGGPFLLIDLFEESAMRIAGNPLEVLSIDFFPAVFALITAIIAIHHVRGLAVPGLAGAAARSGAAERHEVDPWRGFDLSDRERQVAALAGEGMANGAIAAQLFISESTVKKHLNSVFRKTGFESRHRLIAAAYTSAHRQPSAPRSGAPGSAADTA